MNALTTTRKCAMMLNGALQKIGLGNLAEHFDGEDPDQWQILDPTEIYVVKDKVRRATILLDNDTATIVIPRVDQLVRREHRSKFDHRQYLIQDVPNKDFKGDHEPQLTVTCSIPADDEILQGRRRFIPRKQSVVRRSVTRQYTGRSSR